MSASSSGATSGRSSTTNVLGFATAAVVLGVLVWVIATQRTRAVDAHERLSAWFDVKALPFGLEPVEAAVMPRGDELLRLSNPNAPAETPRNTVEPPKEGEPRKPIDWAKIPTGAEGSAPIEVVITRIPLAAAPSELRALLHEGQDLRGDFKSIGDQGGQRVIERGELPWSGFNSDFAYVREFEPGGTFRDSMRVNLSRKDEPCVLLARWPRGVPASKPRAEELLSALVPRS